MSDLWATRRAESRRSVEPLAVRMRPRTLDEFVGQEHILGEGKLLRRMIHADAITSLILHGPPGTGKTTLAEVIAASTRRRFVRENAASVGVKRIREIIDEAARAVEDTGRRTILFLDEIHRFTKAQQDVLLGDVERGLITLIGATTENPLFAVNAALISRSTLFRLEPLTEEEIKEVVRRAIADPERGFGNLDVGITDEALQIWALKCEGDARRALTALEVAVQSTRAGGASDAGRIDRGSGGRRGRGGGDGGGGAGAGDRLDPVGRPGLPDGSAPAAVDVGEPGETPGAARAAPAILIDARVAQDSIQQKVTVYDTSGDGHYDAASALIKSLRGSDPDAAVYWIAHMLEGGEDPRFIARRMAILASEDVGNADPHAIVMAHAAWSLCERIGMPEARITLSQLACYLALAPKSNAAYNAINAAQADVRNNRARPVPMFLRDPNSSPITEGEGAGVRMREREGERYVYSHEAGGEGRYGVTAQDYLGVEASYYQPREIGAEAGLAARLAEIKLERDRLRREIERLQRDRSPA